MSIPIEDKPARPRKYILIEEDGTGECEGCRQTKQVYLLTQKTKHEGYADYEEIPLNRICSGCLGKVSGEIAIALAESGEGVHFTFDDKSYGDQLVTRNG